MNLDKLEDQTTKTILPWHSLAWQRLLTQVHEKTLPHAFLFTGVAGIGKKLLAKSLASYLLCERSNQIENVSVGLLQARTSCGQCKQCKLFESETHPDFKFLEPEEGSSAIKIDQVRQLVSFFSQSSQQGGRKIALLSPAEALNNNAANALLKTLEEPSLNSVIILVSHQSGMLLPTIRSRCQVVDFSLPSISESFQWLKSKAGDVMTEESLSEANILNTLALAHSAPLKALSYMEEGALVEYERMLDELGSLLKNECLSSTLANRWNDDMAILRLSWMMLWLEQIIKLKSGIALTEGHSATKMFMYLTEKTSFEELFDLYGICLKQYKLFLGTSNPNKVLAFEMLLHCWSSLMRKA